MINYDVDSNMITCDSLDVSNTQMILEAIGYLKAGLKIRINGLVCSDIDTKANITFIGRIYEQDGNGIVISSFKDKEAGIIIDLK